MEYSVGIVDYVVVVLSLLLCVGIGYLSGRSGSKRLDRVSEFLLASRQMAMIPTAFSIMATLLSGNAIAGAIGEVYVYGLTSAFAVLGGTITKILAAYFIVPVFHAIEYTSIYEYMEKRFDRSTRTIFAGLYVLCNIIYLGTVLYGPSVSLTTVSGIPYWATVSAIGLICTLYCVMGGLKAVIWTDVMQALMMFLCVFLVIVEGTRVAGGFGNIYDVAFAPGVRQFEFVEGPSVRYTVFGMLIASACTTVKSSVAGQAGAQRFLCVENKDIAKRSLILSSFIMLSFKVFTCIAAMAIYTLYSRCDPRMQSDSKITEADQIYIYSVSRLLSHIPGLQGLALAGLLSASLSTCSSYINSFATITLQDFVKPYFPRLAKNQRNNILLCKIFTFLFGVLAILMSFLVPFMGGIVQVSSGVSGAVLGPLAGAMLVALFSWRTNSKSCKVALLIGMLITVWLTLGSILYPMNFRTLPHSTEDCPVLNSSFTDQLYTSNITSKLQAHEIYSMDDVLKKYVFPLRIIPFIWYAPIGMTVTYCLAVIFSQFMGGNVRPDPKFLSPIAARRMQAYDSRMNIMQNGIGKKQEVQMQNIL